MTTAMKLIKNENNFILFNIFIYEVIESKTKKIFHDACSLIQYSMRLIKNLFESNSISLSNEKIKLTLKILS